MVKYYGLYHNSLLQMTESMTKLFYHIETHTPEIYVIPFCPSQTSCRQLQSWRNFWNLGFRSTWRRKLWELMMWLLKQRSPSLSHERWRFFILVLILVTFSFFFSSVKFFSDLGFSLFKNINEWIISILIIFVLFILLHYKL